MSWSRPLPAPDKASADYWAATAKGELIVQQCTSCGHRQFYPRLLCTECAGEPEWIRCSGRGVVHTYTVIRDNKTMLGEPYVVAMIELAEGVRMMSNVTDIHPDDVRIGMPVQVHFAETDADLKIPLFRPIGVDAQRRGGRER